MYHSYIIWHACGGQDFYFKKKSTKIVCSVCICMTTAWQVNFLAKCKKFPPPTYNVWYLYCIPYNDISMMS